jgi:DNA invertase Pin-like site-specific DNA recombinase
VGASFARLAGPGAVQLRRAARRGGISLKSPGDDSMGRLTLNMLLSFAQFEREIAGERIRDKIAASKRKGMWMGGNAPLGYDVKDRKLIVNETEASTVRWISQRYAELGSVSLLSADRADADAAFAIKQEPAARLA